MYRIIIAEDDPELQDIYRIILGKAGYELTIFSGGREILAHDYIRPDLFLLDKQLSGIDGLDICRFLKSFPATKKIPVIIISATFDIQQLVKNAGADAFIEKPFDRHTLLQVIAETIAATQVAA